MNPILDRLLVSASILSALGWFLWRALRRKSGSACGAGCGCEAKRAVK